MDTNIERWITVNGAHIPIKKNSGADFESLNKLKSIVDGDKFSVAEWADSLKDPKCTSDDNGLNYMLS